MKPPKFSIFIFSFFMITCVFSFAQSADRISYQSIIRDASGELVRSKTVGIKISILQGSETGAVVYVETHQLATNINGLASLKIGDGTPKEGSFPSINWSNYPFFLKVETDPEGGDSYTVSGTTEILFVPYALYAKNVQYENQTLSDVITKNNEANGQIKNVTDPTDDQDAATKAYVDALLTQMLSKLNVFVDSRDGNYYNTVKIGDQIWMAENLAYLPSVQHPSTWSSIHSRYYVFDYSGTNVSEAKATENYDIYGVLYNWPAASNACPSGWHLPTDAEWTTLNDYLVDNGYGYGGSGDDIGKALASRLFWSSSSHAGDVGNDLLSNNISGFGALPGGYCSNGIFYYDGNYGCWWSATKDGSIDAWYQYLYYDLSYFSRFSNPCETGLSVRCVKD